MERVLSRNNNSSSLPEDWTWARFGSESCHILMPSIGIIKSISERLDPLSLTLVTPIALPGNIAQILILAEEALELGWREVVVNDWGVLNELSMISDSRLTAGRLLMKLRRGPGRSDNWEDMDDASRRYFAWGPLFDSQLLELLKEKGVGRLEIDPPRHWFPLPQVDDFHISMHGDYRLISISSRCPYLYKDEKTGWKSPESCESRCYSCLASPMVRMESEALDRPLFQYGREILEKCDDDWGEDDIYKIVDRIIYSEAGMVSARNTKAKD